MTSHVIEFLCNLCGKTSTCPSLHLTREDPSCGSCGSSVPTRSLLRALSLELFQVNLPLPDFPRLKSLRGLGISDSPQYAEALSAKFDYRNTFHDRAPQFDLMKPPSSELGQYDFVIVSDVLEHVPPPAETGFHNAYALLKPGGVVVMSVPYSIEDSGTIEHFPQLNDFSVIEAGGRSVLLNRTSEGTLQVFENLAFHLDLTPSLEMREFSEHGLKQMLASAGFDEIRWHGDGYPQFGIVWREPWSLPLALRKGEAHFDASAIRELMGELVAANRRATASKSELHLLNQPRWVKLGRSLGTL